jgi:hypothetical protein
MTKMVKMVYYKNIKTNYYYILQFQRRQFELISFHFSMTFLEKARPVWTGFKIAVRHKLLTHYKKAKVLYD